MRRPAILTVAAVASIAAAAVACSSGSSDEPTPDGGQTGSTDASVSADGSSPGSPARGDGGAGDGDSGATGDSGASGSGSGGSDGGAMDGGGDAAADGGDAGTDNGPPSLGLTAADLSFEDTFGTLSRAADMSARWQSQFWFYEPGARADQSDTVYLDETVTLSDGTTRNPFVGTTPGRLDIIAASLGSATATDYTSKSYYSGALTTLPSFHQNWGYYEVTVQMPPKAGAWGAFFLYPFTDYPGASRTSGEMDFIECIGSEPTVLNTTTHDYTDDGATGKAYTDAKIDFTAAVHTLGFDFEPSGVIRYIDGAKFDTKALAVPTDWTDKTWYVVLSHDVDLTSDPKWAGNSPDPTSYPKHMQVERVRVFRTPSTTVIGGSAALIKLP